MNKKEYFLGKYFSVTQPFTKLNKILKYVLVSIKKRKFDKMYIIYPKELPLEEKRKAAITASLSHLGINDARYNNDKNIGINQLKSILNFCEEKGFRPILISTPQTSFYNKQIGDENYHKRIYDNIKKVEIQLNKKYLYLDYSHDKRFVNNLEYFMDSDHLNEKGAEYFTEILLFDLKSQGYDF